MKKFLCIMMTVIMALSLVALCACGGSPEPDPQNPFDKAPVEMEEMPL